MSRTKDGAESMRIMALDLGSKTVGVALSDPLLLTAQGLEIIRRKEENKLRASIEDFAGTSRIPLVDLMEATKRLLMISHMSSCILSKLLKTVIDFEL